MMLSLALLSPLLGTALGAQGFSDPDIAVLVQQALVSDARQLALSPDALGRSTNRRPDLDVAADVRRVLAARMGKQLPGLTVSCVDGEVLLRGRGLDDKAVAQALALAAAVVGARSIKNELTTDGSAKSVPASSRRAAPAGPARSEPFLFLTWDGLAGAQVEVSVENGLVQLHGVASSAAARNYATSSARLVPGVRSVTNRMQLRPSSREDDDRLSLLIARRFDSTFDLRPYMDVLTVTVTHGVAVLQGTLDTESQRGLAVDLARTTRGILVVDDRIQLAGG